MDYKVITEHLYNSYDLRIGHAVLLVLCDDDDILYTIESEITYYGKDKEVAYGLVQTQEVYNNLQTARDEYKKEVEYYNNNEIMVKHTDES